MNISHPTSCSLRKSRRYTVRPGRRVRRPIAPGAGSVRTRRFKRAWLFALAITVMALLWPRSSLAEPFALTGTDWEGCSELVRLARAEVGQDHVVVADKLDMTLLAPEDAVLMLHPEKTVDAAELAKFMHAGGRVLLLDDFGKGDGLLRHFGMERVPLPESPAETLRRNPHLALAEPASAHPVVAEVQRVVTNHATGIKHPDLSPVLKVRSSDPRTADVPVGVAGAVGKGRLLILSDPSIVMNSMLRYAGNKALAKGIVHYALDDDTWGTRNGRIFIVSGAFAAQGRYGGGVSEVDAAIAAIRELIEGVRTQGMPPAMLLTLAVGTGLSLVVWVATRAAKVHKPQAPRFTRKLASVAHGGVAGHAAVVASPQASRILAMLELKHGLEEDLCVALGLDALPPQSELVDVMVRRRLLDAEGIHTLRQLLLKMATVETLVLARKGSPPPAYKDRDLVEAATEVKRIVQEVERNRVANKAIS